MLSFFVPGLPVPQGSKRAFIVRPKGGRPRPVLAESAKDLKPWRAQVALAAKAAVDRNGGGWFTKQPLFVRLKFLFLRPASLPKKKVHHVVRPDVDKLARAVLDALKGVVYGDDGQIGELHVRKAYTSGAICGPGVGVEVREVSGT